MKKTTKWIAIIIILVLAIGAYALSRRNSGQPAASSNNYQGSATSSAGTQPTANTQSSNQNQNTSAAATAANKANVLTLNTASTAALGTFLTAANGMTLYMYTPDKPGVSNCSGQCAVIWPPYTVSSAAGLVAATGISGKIGTITRSDGSMQLTYNNQPLYYYAKDSKPADTTGQGVGGVWYVVKP